MARDLDALITTSRLGDAAAGQQLFGEVYERLREIAHRKLRQRERGEAELTTSDLLHETYVKLFRNRAPSAASRAHFVAIAARAMRLVLIDTARELATAKRGGPLLRVDVAEADLAVPPLAEDLLALDAALVKLFALDERLGRVVELRFFGCMTEDEIGTELGLTARTVRRDWRTARAFLLKELRPRRDGLE
jgi:RNA polymerase sigma factor (TIGR02999 family)